MTEKLVNSARTSVWSKSRKTFWHAGPNISLSKRGEYGVLMFHEKGVFGAPAFPLEMVKDPTGAGDTFAGGFMGICRPREIFPISA